MKPGTSTLLWIEWGSLLGAIILLVTSQTYHPRVNLAVGLLALSWVARWVRIKKLARSTPIDIPLLLFVLSALIALWAAPNRLTGLVRFYLLLAAISLFYTLVNSDFRSLRIFSTVFVAFVGIFGIFLVSQYDWSQGMARFAPIEASGRWLNRVIPDLGLTLPHWNATRNMSASLLALTLPLALARLLVGRAGFKSSNNISASLKYNLSSVRSWFAASGTILIVVALTLTESRTPWMAFSLIISLLIWWWLSGFLKTRLSFSRRNIFMAGLGLAFVLVGLILISQPQSLSTITRIPGPDDYLNRGEIYPQSLRLAQDTPFTGGGLAAFPALYSAYIRVIPHNAFLNEDTGNNAYLNLLVEQGWLGAVSYVSVLGIALIVALQRIGRVRNQYRGFVIAGAIGLGFILIQGFVHSTLVASRAIPALLVPAGLALSGSPINQLGSRSVGWGERWTIVPNFRWPVDSWHLASAVTLVTLFAVSLLAIRNSLLSTWYADLGAVHMARVELADFPTGKWDEGSTVAALSPAEDLFQRALQFDANNRTAHHRLGLIPMLRRDFAAAVTHLGKAHDLDPGHRGIRKSLGYSYVWSGRPERATALLAAIPEAEQELSVYIWWWGTQNRPDLSAQAQTANLLLGEDE